MAAGLGETRTVNFTLKISAAQADMTVMSEAPLINVENPNTTTTITGKAIQDLPNPGGDMTYPAQFAPGALINTAGSSNDFVGGQNGYGNVQFNGLPALSNAYIVDGLETNDPLTNLNSGLATNLVLGLNSIEEVTVNTTSYAVDQGRYGASQINYITKSGTNTLHGNLYELWNGSRLNAANFFTNATAGNRKPRSTVNHFGGSLGGPVSHDKLFFFGDFEQMRIALPIVNTVTLPSTAFQSYVLEQLPKGGVDTVSGTAYPAAPALVPFYKKMFSLYPNTAGTALPVLGCPSSGWRRGRGLSAQRKRMRHSSHHIAIERRPRTGDYGAGRPEHRYRQHGLVPLPVGHGIAGGLHGPDQPAVQLHFLAAAILIRRRIHTHFQPEPAELLQPGILLVRKPVWAGGPGQDARVRSRSFCKGPAQTLRSRRWGASITTGCRDRRATRFQINDNLAWTAGPHQFKFGIGSRRLRINDYDFSNYVTPLVEYTTLAQFIYGVASTATKAFPVAASQPFNYLNLDLFAQDTVKVTSKLTWTLGVRTATNTEPGERARPDCAAAGLIRRGEPQPGSAPESGAGDGFEGRLFIDAAGYVAAPDGGGLAICAADGGARRIRRVQRSVAGEHRGPDRLQSAVHQHVPGRSAGPGRRTGHRAGRGRTARLTPPSRPTRRF